MSGRHWLYARLTGALIAPERAEKELDLYRTEVLREAAGILRSHADTLPGRDEYLIYGLLAGANLLEAS